MFRIFTLIILGFALITTPLQAQTIQQYELIASYSKEELSDILDNFGIPSSIFGIDYDVEVYKVWYDTPNATGTAMTTATGAVVFPKGYHCNLPLASYEHGTVSVKTNVPSYQSQELTIGMLWAGAGYAVTLPDYLGLGDSPGMHPYIHAKSEATASIDLIKAAQTMATELNYHLGEDLFVFGYSQGGHAAVATCKEIQENHAEELTVTACYGMSGPYDVSGLQTDFVNSGFPYATPGYLPYIFLGYQSVYGNLYQNSISEVLIPPYDTLLPPLFDGTVGLGYINSLCAPIPADMLTEVYENDFNTNPNNPFRLALQDNDLMDWKPEFPMRLYYCTQDEQVFYENAIAAKDAFIAQGATDVYSKNLGDTDHGGCVELALVNAFFSMDSLKTAPTTLLQDVFIDPGSITLIPHEDAGNLTYVWSTGSSSAMLDGLEAGDYTVTITSDVGCEVSYTFNVPYSTSVTTAHAPSLVTYPNPVSEQLHISLPQTGNYHLHILDMNGQMIQQTQLHHKDTHLLDWHLPKGVYFIKVWDDDTGQMYVSKIVGQ